MSATVVVVLGSGASALAASGGGGNAHARRVQPPAAGAASGLKAGTRAAASGTSSPSEFSTTANPVTLDPPVKVPPTKPVVVTIADNASFGNAPPPATSTVSLPSGRWATVVLDITGSEQGRQFDRLLDVYDGATQIFLGVTPEPTTAGITWHVQKDITGYLPILRGTQTFSTTVDNFLSSVDNGIPVITAKLLFFPPGGGFGPARPASLAGAGGRRDQRDRAIVVAGLAGGAHSGGPDRPFRCQHRLQHREHGADRVRGGDRS